MNKKLYEISDLYVVNDMIVKDRYYISNSKTNDKEIKEIVDNDNYRFITIERNNKIIVIKNK